jgi:23S rRNA pseudouridine2605 synthase
MRLAKYLARAGVASRRAAESVVRAGRVTVDGAVVTDPARPVGPDAVVTIDGVALASAPAPVVYALNKPAGVVSSARDPRGRPTVLDLISSPARLYPVGRLDIDTTGLILVTNDGDLAYRLTHPRFEVPKTYRATVAQPPIRKAAIEALREGVELDDGRTAPAKVRRLGPGTLELTIHEGRNRQIKRMCAAVGHPVRQLERIAVGNLALGSLKPGSYRRLTQAEVAALSGDAGPAVSGDAGPALSGDAGPAGRRRSGSSRSTRPRPS